MISDTFYTAFLSILYGVIRLFNSFITIIYTLHITTIQIQLPYRSYSGYHTPFMHYYILISFRNTLAQTQYWRCNSKQSVFQLYESSRLEQYNKRNLGIEPQLVSAIVNSLPTIHVKVIEVSHNHRYLQILDKWYIFMW